MERIKIRGLAYGTSVVFTLWGAVVSIKGLYYLFGGEPEANLFSPRPWQFVTREQWMRYGGFELAYGLACLALGWALWRYARFLPQVISRPRREPEFQLFD
ncbi:MAG: hypothetical protein IIB09_06015 [Bacteroidetes bacterium]|nr:hypothetical protein [Bacteroidota bacterium]